MDDQLAEWLEDGYVASFRTACLILGNRADAEEAVQDAYLRAWRFRDSLTAVPSIRPWLYRVVVNSCYSKLRREIPHRDRRAGDEPLAHVAEGGGGPDARRAVRGGRDRARRAAAAAAVAAGARRPALLRRPEREGHRTRHRPAAGNGEVTPARGPPRLADDPALCALAEGTPPQREIALAIGRRQGTVKSRLHEARRRLADDPALCALAGAGDATRTEETGQ